VNWLLASITFFIGILIGWLLPALQKISFASTIDAGNVLNVIATLALAAAINVFLTNKVSTKQALTTVLSDHLTEALMSFRALQQAAKPCHTGDKLSLQHQAELTLAERELSNSLHSFEQALICCKVEPLVLDLDKAKRAREALKKALTDSPFPGPYAPGDWARIATTAKAFRDEVTRLSVAIHSR
jgi:hypothetical protein